MVGFLRTLLGAMMVVGITGISHSADHSDLVKLFHDWRAFEAPPKLDGAPDYTAATFSKRHADLADFQNRLRAMDTSGIFSAQK